MPDLTAPELNGLDSDRLAAYRKWLQYFAGELGHSEPLSNRRRQLRFNYAKAIVEKGVAFLMTDHHPIPAAHQLEGADPGAAIAALEEVWEANDLQALDQETEVDTATLGDGCFKVSWDQLEERIVVTAPDVQGIFAWYTGGDTRRLWRVAQRYTLDPDDYEAMTGQPAPARTASPRITIGTSDDARSADRSSGQERGVELVELWTTDEYQLWVQNELADRQPNPYGRPPFVIYPNVPRPKRLWGMSDIEPIEGALLELNRAYTQVSRILELSGNPITILENVEGSDNVAVEPGAVWDLPENSRAYLLDLLANQNTGSSLHAVHIDALYRVISDLSEVPRVTFGDAEGTEAGVALQLKLDPILRRTARKRRARTAAMRARDRLILDVLNHHTGSAFAARTDIAWAPVYEDAPAFQIPGGVPQANATRTLPAGTQSATEFGSSTDREGMR